MDTVRQWGRATPGRLSLSRPVYREAALGLAIFALVLAHQLDLARQPRTLAIRQTLIDAAATTGTLPATASGAEVRAALRRDLPMRAADIDPSRFPGEVDVTYRGLGRTTCLEARSVAQRIEGSVVDQLDGYRSAAACGDRNAMTWRILP
ncbi:MAG TPA: hypothetical protein VN802_23820 [Stellaceae bacterium]|nr:hypothetical protein [Stellaceae bacterium]